MGVTFALSKSSKSRKSDTSSAEQTFLSPTVSPHADRVPKHLMKAPLPFPKMSTPAFSYTYGATITERDAMRASNDNQLVKLMHEKEIQKEYFFNPPLHWISLNFIDEEEKKKEDHGDESH